MLSEMTAEQFTEWAGFALLEPFGDEWRQSAMIAQQIHAKPVEGYTMPQRTTLEDFMPRVLRKRQTDEEMMAIFDQFINAHNKAVNNARARS